MKRTILPALMIAVLTVGLIAQGATTKPLPLDNLGLEHLDIIVPDPAASARHQPREIATVLPVGIRPCGRTPPRLERACLVSAGARYSPRSGGGGAGSGAWHRALHDCRCALRSSRAGDTAAGSGCADAPRVG